MSDSERDEDTEGKQSSVRDSDVENRVTQVKWLAESAWKRYQNRRSVEWKLHFALWAAFGSAAGFVAGRDVALSTGTFWALAIIAVLVFLAYLCWWAPWIQKAHYMDSRQCYWWSSAIEEMIDMRLPKDLRPDMLRYRNVQADPECAPDQQESKSRWKKWRDTVGENVKAMWHPNARAQVAITFLLSLLFIFACGARWQTSVSMDKPRVIIEGGSGNRIEFDKAKVGP